RQAILSEIDSSVGEERSRHPTHDALVEVFAAEKRVSRSGKHFKHAVVHFKDRNIESAATEIVNRDTFDVRFAQAIRQSRCCRLVDDALDFQSRNLARVFGGLALRVVKVSGNSNDGISDCFAEEVFGSGFQTLQDDTRQLRRTVVAALNSNPSITVWRVHDLERRSLAHLADFLR